jgi:STE24 endopeptidase
MKKIIFFSLHFFLCFSGLYSSEFKYDTININSEKTDSFNITQATNEYLKMLTPEQKEKSDSYFEGGYWIQLLDILAEILVTWIFLSMGLSQWIKKIALKNKKVNIQNLIYILFYLLFTYIITFPFTVYKGYFREHHFNLSNMTFGGWFKEEIISLILVLFIGSLIITFLYFVIRKLVKSWWIWGSLGLIVFAAIIMFFAPVYISPLFNDYTALPDGKIKDEILSMARANGVPANNVYLFNASKQSSRISANVSGFGSTIRISLNDNLLNRCNTEEIKSVMAHELGHYVLNHIYIMMFYFGILIIIGFAFINKLFILVIRKFGFKWKIDNIADIGGLPLVVLLFSIYMFIATPFVNTLIRTQEIEADIFGLNAGREPDGAASVAMKLSEYRKINPSRIEEIIFFDHPSGKTRVLNAMRWKAENLKNKQSD